MFRYMALFFCVCMATRASAQAPAAGDNLVPNPGFELYFAKPTRWTYSGADFEKIVKYWFSATTASPDIYGPDVTVPGDWAYQGFGKQAPRSGHSMAGLTLYGCEGGKPHCREYIQIQLREPLVKGQTYLVEFWVTHLERSLQINNIGAYFSVKEIRRLTDEVLVRKAQVKADKIVEAPDGKWVKVSGYFKAEYPAEHILIGNFSDDAHTRYRRHRDDCYNFAYYYIDDVLVKKVPPFLPVPVKPDDLTRQTFETGKTLRLRDIYFAFDSDELMPRSYVELDKLLDIMRKKPALEIEIIGHTDNVGDEAYNQGLSERRANAVIVYLMRSGIPSERLRAKGEGENKPIADNNTEAGRALNRRVELRVLKN